ncbi:hypothetical protein [Umezawaea sp. Da 62-37]|uniref:hypothetical protein n=1 Tax=Umezawaea sp. Da 62-37 TaxID=3075927 RepID=UPI0028F70CF2|nr:hypothetical protein [Umezawaea sp. Da 62-37]WNV89956.1 hypothetical protein RM788_17145 [Umezawaea sp. Da 62-37]
MEARTPWRPGFLLFTTLPRKASGVRTRPVSTNLSPVIALDPARSTDSPHGSRTARTATSTPETASGLIRWACGSKTMSVTEVPNADTVMRHTSSRSRSLRSARR